MVFGFGEGKIEIKLEKFSFNPQEKILGKLFLSLNKPKQARQLRIVFRGTRTETYYSGGKQRRNFYDIHNAEIKLDGEKEYSGTLEYGFEFDAPNIPIQQPRKMEGALGAVMQVASVLSQKSVRTEWFLDASLDCQGFDVNKKVQITVNQ